MILAPNLSALPWLQHGFGQKDSAYPDGITTLKQIHSCIVVDGSGLAGDRIREGDGLTTRAAGEIVGVRTADCVPVLLADKVTRAVAAVHAGWRGTAGRIVPEAVRLMQRQFGTSPADVVAAVGPSIGGCCYQVGDEVASQFETWLPEMKQGVRLLDLKRVNALQLTEAGVRDIWISTDCTFCKPGYWSYRRDREGAGRMLSFIGAGK